MNGPSQAVVQLGMAWGTDRKAVASCVECGGKYRPAGGPCIHEHPRGVLRQAGPVCCLSCGVVWQPGHVCVADGQGQDLVVSEGWTEVCGAAVEAAWETRTHQGVAAPASWEAV